MTPDGSISLDKRLATKISATLFGWNRATNEAAMEFWGSALTTVAACGGVGVFLDFWIGKVGQQRVKGWLETWWLRLSYVRWTNFGREEALFAVQVMDRLFGRHLFSTQRMIVVVL